MQKRPSMNSLKFKWSSVCVKDGHNQDERTTVPMVFWKENNNRIDCLAFKLLYTMYCDTQYDSRYCFLRYDQERHTVTKLKMMEHRVLKEPTHRECAEWFSQSIIAELLYRCDFL